LDFSGSVELLVLPDELRVPRLDVSNCRQLRGLPVGLQCGELILRRTNFESLPADLAAKYIDAQDCRRLKVVPPLQVETLRLRGCAAVEALPEGLAARDLFWGAVYGLPRCQQARRLRLGKSI
jgi:hypothetical protein